MMELYSASDLAKWVGVTRQAVSKAFRDVPLAEAKVGRKIDVQHPQATRWLEDHGVDANIIDPVTKAPRSAEDIALSMGPSREDEPLDRILDLTLRELTERHGTSAAFVDWLKARKELAAAKRQEHLLNETQGRLINREFVKLHVFGLLEQLAMRLLGDASHTISVQILSSAKGNEISREELEVWVREIIGENLRHAKEQMTQKIERSAERET